MRLPSWRATLTAGIAACLLLPFLAEAERLSLGLLVAFVCTVLAGLGLRANIDRSQLRVWLSLYLGLVCFVVGVLVRSIHGLIVDDPFPFPSPADTVVMAGYIFIFFGLLDLARARRHENNWADLLDAMLVGALIGLPFWALAVAPFLVDDTVPVAVRVLDGAYSAITIALVVATALLAVGPGKRNPSYYLLAFSMFVLFIIDTGAILDDMGVDQAGSVISYVFPVAFIAWAAGVLHPEIRRLTDRPELQEPRLTRRRIAISVAAVLVVPVLLFVEVRAGHDLEIVMTSVGSAIIALLVLALMTDLVRANERSVARERVRAATAEELVSATDTSEIADAVVRGAYEVAARSKPVGCVMVLGLGPEVQLAASTDPGHRLLIDRGSRMTLDGRLLAAVAGGRPVRLPGALVVGPDRLTVAGSGIETLAFPLVVRGTLRGIACLIANGHVDRATERVLDSIAWEACLALQSAELRRDLAFQQTERRYRAMFENSSDLVCVVDEEARISFTSPAIRHLLDVEPDAVVGRTFIDLVHDRDRAKAASMMRSALKEDAVADPLELRLATPDGSVRWVEAVARDLRREREIAGLVVTARDVTDRRSAEGQLANSEARFRALVQNSSDVVGVLDGEGHFIYLSPAISTTLGYRPEELIGHSAFDLLDDGESSEVAYSSLWETSEFTQRRTEVSVPDRYGRLHTLDVTLTDLRTEPAVGGVVLNARDISDNRELERSLRHQAMHDALTGLPNREAFSNSVGEALNRPDSSGEGLAVVIVDLDDFKTINDSLGHETGDEVLTVVAERIRNCLRLSDAAARLGADEFAVLLDPVGTEGEAISVTERVLESIREPVAIGGRRLELSASAGIARRSVGQRTSQELIRSADMAMHRAKEEAKGAHALFRDHMQESMAERLELQSALTRAIDRDEFLLYYQPILDMDGRTMRAAEALIRWRHPERGVLAPGAFIALAEETGQIVQIGAWVLREAIRQLGVWRRRDLIGDDFTLDVNLSPLQLRDPTVVELVADSLTTFSVPPHCLVLEITESLLIEDGSGCKERLEELRSLGVRLAVDDFGTGYSSLSYIQRFPIDVIKIDRSFVTGLGTNPGDGAVVQSMIELSQRLGVHTVAEGIDRPEQVTLLQSLGADLGQGYLFSK
ncbi:MAG: EAL domain-containing protein, partial [Acidimicrobiales bacterium]|nr:EAL domain-containing protein [Acidimicrobiales bacterium]